MCTVLARQVRQIRLNPSIGQRNMPYEEINKFALFKCLLINSTPTLSNLIGLPEIVCTTLSCKNRRRGRAKMVEFVEVVKVKR
jgi:hypothetical protein